MGFFGGGAGSPAGSTGQLQYNNSGAFGASANLTFSGSTLTLGVAASSTGVLSISNSSSGTTLLTSDGANILAIRSGANAQAVQFYNTYTDAANYERGFFRCSASGLVFGTESAGTGAAFNMNVSVNGTITTRLTNAQFRLGSAILFGWASAADPVANGFDIALARNAAGVVEVNNGTAGTFRDLILRACQHNGVTYANRPGTPVAGMVIYVTDSTVTTAGSTVAGGGANKVLAWYNGTNWTVIGN